MYDIIQVEKPTFVWFLVNEIDDESSNPGSDGGSETEHPDDGDESENNHQEVEAEVDVDVGSMKHTSEQFSSDFYPNLDDKKEGSDLDEEGGEDDVPVATVCIVMSFGGRMRVERLTWRSWSIDLDLACSCPIALYCKSHIPPDICSLYNRSMQTRMVILRSFPAHGMVSLASTILIVM